MKLLTAGGYLLAHDSSFSGKSSFDLKDNNDHVYMKDLVADALKLEPGEIKSIHYGWADGENTKDREKMSYYFYFKPFDIIVVANIYEDDLVIDRVKEDLIRIVIIAASFIIVMFFVSLYISREIANPLVHAQHSVERLGKGDFSTFVDMRTKILELKLLGDSVDKEMIPKISRIIEEVLTAVRISGNINKILENYSNDADSVSGKIGKDVERIDRELNALDNQINEVSSAVTEILATIENLVSQIENQTSAVTQTSAAIEQMSASLSSIAKIAGEKSAATSKLIETVEAGRKKVTLSNEQIKDISSDIDNMMGIIGVINSIAAQTNLLAMNAAIEAAHAGEYGAGFAVVADEIRNLAESTGSNAKTIADSLKAAVAKMGSVIKAGEESKKRLQMLRERSMSL